MVRFLPGLGGVALTEGLAPTGNRGKAAGTRIYGCSAWRTASASPARV